MVAKDDQDDDFSDKLLIVGRVLATILVGVLGMYGFAMVGSLSYPGVGVVIGGLIGLILCGCFGCCVTGLWKHAVPDSAVGTVLQAVPAPVAFAIGEHGPFTLIVTVHEITGKGGVMAMLGDQLGAGSFTFVQVDCGNNPVKRTCAKPELKYNEQFKLKVKAIDSGITFTLKDQDVFGTTTVGQVNINIKRDILTPRDSEPFPKTKSYPIANRSGSLKDHAGVQLVLSFDHTDDYAGDHRNSDTVTTPLLPEQHKTYESYDPALQTVIEKQFVTAHKCTFCPLGRGPPIAPGRKWCDNCESKRQRCTNCKKKMVRC